MDCMYWGKPIFPTKEALNEMSEISADLDEVKQVLEAGFALRKRKKNIVEKAARRGEKVMNVVLVETASYFKLIHVGEFSLSKKFKKMLKEETKNGF